MIITCPECATRYELDEDRFLPNGRSVRCTSCGESWFVPAPQPIDDLRPLPRETEEPHRENRFREAMNGHGRDDEPRRRAEPSFSREEARSEPSSEEKRRPRFRMEDEGSVAEAVAIDEEEEKDLLPPRDEKGRFMAMAREQEEADIIINDLDDDEDDALFDTPVEDKARSFGFSGREADDEDDDLPPKGWRKGKQFYVEDDGEDGRREDHGGFREKLSESLFARRASKEKAKDARPDQRDEARPERAERPSRVRETERFAEAEERYRDEREEESFAPRHRRAAHADRDRADESRYDDSRYYERRRYEARDDRYDEGFDYDDEDDIIPGEATIVDADWEAVDDEASPRFGRRIREERRRATALARLEDVRRFEPEALDEEFFASLRVTPRELEKAVRKARRRAESRDKNRLTPWRAFGWSAWVAAVAAAAYAVVAYRDEIVKVAPSAADAYAVVGIETDPSGLKIENVSHRLAMSTAGPVIEITGALRNNGEDAMNAPLLQAEALGARGELLSRWTFTPAEPTVDGNASVDFATRNAAPEGVAEVALSFAPAETAVSRLMSEKDK